MAEYDLPSVIDFIQEQKSSKAKVSLIGYSQGTTVVAAAAALNPDYYKEKVNIAVLIGPAIEFKYSFEPNFVAMSKQVWFEDLLLAQNYLEFDGKHKDRTNDIMAYIQVNYAWACYLPHSICNLETLTPAKIDSSPSVNLKRSDQNRLKDYMHCPGGTSTINFIHMGQLYKSKKFQKYDYGLLQNL